MTEEAAGTKETAQSTPKSRLDALVIGAGVAGLYQLHLLRSQGTFSGARG
jgi:cation diffusion facilitator CzcD-associated flavoprotein CzcO